MDAAKKSSIEDQIKSAWLNILQVPEIQPEQNFFDLGGNSLLMIDMLALLNAELEMEISPALLFEDASLQGFSHLVSAQKLEMLAAHEGTI